MSHSKTDFTTYEKVQVTFKSSTPLDKQLDRASLNLQESKKYQSKQNDQETVRRIPVRLPIDLNSFKYLGGGGKEQGYLLVSEYFKLQEDDQLNKITFEAAKDNTLVRVYFEDSNLTLKSKDQADQIKYRQGNVVQFKASAGKHTLYFEHFTDQAKKRRLYYGDDVLVTILIAESDFVDKQFTQHMKDALTDCDNSSFPLALSKNTKYNLADEQTFYTYPLLRIPQSGEFDAANYNFRFNET